MFTCDYCQYSSKIREHFSDIIVVKEKEYKDGNAITLDDLFDTYVFCESCRDDACATMDEQLPDINGAEYWVETQAFWKWILVPKEEQLASLMDEVEDIKEALENIRKRKQPLETGSEAEEEEQPPKKKARTTPKDGETVIDLSADD